MEGYNKTEQSNIERDSILKTLRDERGLYDQTIAERMKNFILGEVQNADLSIDTPEGEIFYKYKEAELYFDAGYTGQAFNIVGKIRKPTPGTKVENLLRDLKEKIFEKFETTKSEKSLLDIAIEAIKFLGIDDPDAQAALANWRRGEDKENATFEGRERIHAEIDSTIYEASIYFEAGFKDKALEVLQEALDTAIAENVFDAQKDIALKMQEYSKS